ncbi:hypothetical protein E2C01_008450 [Portunus trituberculatus]|uniref:Uncharacterized protein n=1 Tax=Portunus trituberculatus TaxID=210409 RepID=A0A5B7D365_PORTR|nr:hypothetical protein [Portunus trituberculatus]
MMSSSGDDDDCDQTESSQVFNPHLQQHPAEREAVIGKWQISHRTPICMCSFTLINTKIFFSISTPHFQTFLRDVTT